MKTMTFNLPLPPSFPPSIAPPSLHRSRLISLSKWFLTPSISLQPFRPRLGLVAGAKHCDRWNESPEKSHLLIKRSEAFSQSKKIYIFFPSFFLRRRQTEEKGKKVSCYLKTIWGFPLSTVNQCCSFCGRGAEAVHFAYIYRPATVWVPLFWLQPELKCLQQI